MPHWLPFLQSHRLVSLSPFRPLPLHQRRQFHRPTQPLHSLPHMFFPMCSPLLPVLHLTGAKDVRNSRLLFDVSHSNCRHSRPKSTAWSLPQLVQPQLLQHMCQFHLPLPLRLELPLPPVLAAPLPFHTTLVPQLGLLPPPPVLPPLPLLLHLPLPLPLFVLVPVVVAPLSCPLPAPQGTVTFIVTVTVVTSTTLPALPTQPTLPTLLLCGLATLPAVLVKFLVVQLVALLPHTIAVQWAFVPPIAQVEGAAVAPLQPLCSLIAGTPVARSPFHPVVQSVSAISIAPALVVGSTILFPCRETARGRLADGRRHREPLLCRSLLWFGQPNCRRLWGRDGAVHDGFMGLVSCLDQLDLRVLCVQETQSPVLGTLPTDQPFRYDGPVGSSGREAGFLFHSSIHSSPIPGIPDLQSLRWRLVSGVVCVCSFYAPHVGIAVDARVWSSGARWQVLCIVSHTPTQGCRCCSLGTPMCGFLLSSLVGHDKLIPPLCPSFRR